MTPALLELLAGKQREWIASVRQPRAIGPIQRALRVVAVRECWRLGAVLIDTDGDLYATGTVILTEEERRHGYPSRLAEERAELRAAARRGGVPAGRTLNLDPVRLDPQFPERPLRNGPSGLEVEWSPGVWTALEPYLWERAQLIPAADTAAG